MKKTFYFLLVLFMIITISICGCLNTNKFSRMKNGETVLTSEIKAHPYKYLNTTVTIEGHYHKLYTVNEQDPTIDYLKLNISENVNNGIVLIDKGIYSVTGIVRILEQEPIIQVSKLEPIYTDAYREGEVLSLDKLVSYPNQYLNTKILVEGYYVIQMGPKESLSSYQSHSLGPWIRLKYEEGINLSILIEEAQYLMEGTVLYEPHSWYGYVSYLMVNYIKPI